MLSVFYITCPQFPVYCTETGILCWVVVHIAQITQGCRVCPVGRLACFRVPPLERLRFCVALWSPLGRCSERSVNQVERSVNQVERSERFSRFDRRGCRASKRDCIRVYAMRRFGTFHYSSVSTVRGRHRATKLWRLHFLVCFYPFPIPKKLWYVSRFSTAIAERRESPVTLTGKQFCKIRSNIRD